MESVPECENCNKTYNTSDRKPKFLTCFHTFCLLCIEKKCVNGKVICPDCREPTVFTAPSVEKGLKTNFHIFNLIDSEATKTNDETTAEATDDVASFYWCGNCKSLLKSDKPCADNGHSIRPIQNEEDRKVAADNLKTVLTTCKIHLNGTMKNHLTMESTLKASQTALQALERHINNHLKENAQQMQETNKDLKKINEAIGHLEKATNSTEDIYDASNKYSEFVIESKGKTKNISNHATAIESLRDAGMSMKVKSRAGNELPVSFFRKTRLDFHAQRAIQHESHMLATMTYLVFLAIQNEPLAIQSQPRTRMLPKPNNSKDLTYKEVSKPVEEFNNERHAVKSRPNPEAAEFVPLASSFLNGLDTRSGEFEQESKNVESKMKEDGFDEREQKSHKATGVSFKSNVNRARSFSDVKHEKIYNQQTHPGDEDESYYWSFPERTTALKLLKHQYHAHPFIRSTPAYNPHVTVRFTLNGQVFGSTSIQIQPKAAPIMCRNFLDSVNHGEYIGTRIFKARPGSYVMGGMTESKMEYLADASPLKKARGAIFLRLKRDFAKTQCSIVSSDFCVDLRDQTEDFRISTVFGYVTDGLNVLEDFSYMDCKRHSITIESLVVH